jgi:Zn-dependent metalloprotease
MSCSRHPLHCIVPPHILHALLQHENERVRRSARNTMLATARSLERRRILGRLTIRGEVGAVAEKRRTIYNARHVWSASGKVARAEGGPPTSDVAVNQAYDDLGATWDFYYQVFHRNSIDDNGMELRGYVHYGDNYDNAFWDGSEMVFGDGDGVVFVGFTGALDVVAHELTHGVTQNTANLDYHGQSGALNESFSDVFGSLVKQHKNDQDAATADWLIGMGILAPGINGVALRSMKAPGTAYDDPKLGGKDPQPANMAHYVELPDDEPDDNGGVHINSGIPNHAFYLLATELGGYAWEDAGQIWYDTLRQLWPKAQFQDCANVAFQVAGQRFGAGSKQQQAVRSAWSEVGITVSEPRARAAGRKTARAGAGDGELKKNLGRLVEAIQKTMQTLE